MESAAITPWFFSHHSNQFNEAVWVSSLHSGVCWSPCGSPQIASGYQKGWIWSTRDAESLRHTIHRPLVLYSEVETAEILKAAREVGQQLANWKISVTILRATLSETLEWIKQRNGLPELTEWRDDKPLVLDLQGQVVILGSPGSGKSTYSASLVGQQLSSDQVRWLSYFPVESEPVQSYISALRQQTQIVELSQISTTQRQRWRQLASLAGVSHTELWVSYPGALRQQHSLKTHKKYAAQFVHSADVHRVI